MADNDIVIIGSGVAGLVLAQGLKRHGIPFRLFERNSRATTKGYRFRVVDAGFDALERTLSPELWQLLEQTQPASSPPYLMLLDAVSAKQIHHMKSSDKRSYPMDRRWLWELLYIGIEYHISFEKPFESYELAENGLMAADGVRSRVRRQFLPFAGLLNVERTVIWGRTPLNDEFCERFNRPDILAEHFACCTDPNRKRRSFLWVPVPWPHEWKLSKASDQLSDQEHYLFFALCSEIPDQSLDTPEARKAYSLEITKSWDANISTLSEMQSETSAIVVNSSKPDADVWETDDRITLMGDAIHAMSPSGGSGGLTAIIDAATLVDVFTAALEENQWSNLKAGYTKCENEMRERTRKAIDVSLAGGQMIRAGGKADSYKEVSLAEK